MRIKDLFAKGDKNFYLLFTITIIAIFFTNPFLKYPYDVYTHLQHIDSLSHTDLIPQGRGLWHYGWAQIFHLLHIDVTQIFLRADIIHYTQTTISFFIVFYFSKVSIRSLFYTTTPVELNYLAYWTTFIWFTMFSTYSVHHHHVWIVWYSMNYQISLLFTLLITALSLTLIFERLSLKGKVIYILFILLFSHTILRIHAMEYIYYLMFMLVLLLIFLDKLFIWWKKYIYYSVPITIIVILALSQLIPFLKTYAYRQSPIFNYLSLEKLPMLLSKIDSTGQLVVNNFNKASTTFNALIYLSLIFVSLLLIIVIYRQYKKYPSYINIRMSIFIFITSLFFFIPLTTLSAGIASLLTYPTISYRFYFSSLLFLVIPSFIFYVLNIIHIKKIYILNLLIVLSLLGTFLFSKYITNSHNYYKNIMSIKSTFNTEKMRFNLSNENIMFIGKQLQYYESSNITTKPLYYYARDDIAFVIKFIYRKPVQYYKRGSKNYLKNYAEDKQKKYFPILFETPENFPNYTRFK